MREYPIFFFFRFYYNNTKHSKERPDIPNPRYFAYPKTRSLPDFTSFRDPIPLDVRYCLSTRRAR